MFLTFCFRRAQLMENISGWIQMPQETSAMWEKQIVWWVSSVYFSHLLMPTDLINNILISLPLSLSLFLSFSLSRPLALTPSLSFSISLSPSPSLSLYPLPSLFLFISPSLSLSLSLTVNNILHVRKVVSGRHAYTTCEKSGVRSSCIYCEKSGVMCSCIDM